MGSELLESLERRVRNDMHSSGRSEPAAITRVINSVCNGRTRGEKATFRRKLVAFMKRKSSPGQNATVLAQLMETRRDLQ